MPEPTPTPTPTPAPAPAPTPTPIPTPTPTPEPGKGAPKQRVVPETYDLKPPKDGHFDDAAVTRAATKFKELGLTQEEAKAAFDYAHSEVTGFRERAETTWNQQVTGWETAAKSDKEIGGANFEKSSKLAQAIIKKFGTPELITELSRGYGNHPELVRLLSRVAVHFDEADLVPPSGDDGKPKEKSTADVLYGGTTK